MAEHLDIDAHGRVIPQGDGARRDLADRAGRFVLLPTAGDLLAARRTPPAEGAQAPAYPRLVVAGDVAAFPVPDFIAFVHQSRLSGTLTVAAGGIERAVGFQDGEVRSAQSSAAGERVGEVAVRLGYVTEAQIAEATRSGRPIGKALVDLGFVKPADLYKCLQEQVAAVFHGLLLAKAGTFTLVDEGPGARAAGPITVSTQSLLMDGARRIDELSLFRARIPGPAAVLHRRTPRRGPSLRPTENALLALVDGRRTVAAVAAAAHLNEFDATKILFHLAEAGYVEAVVAPGAAASPGERVRALAAAANELLRAIVAAVPAGARAAVLDAAQGFLYDETNPHAPVLRGLAVAGDGAVDEAAFEAALLALDPAGLGALDPAGAPARVAFDALREVVFFWLFLAGPRVGPQGDEALARAARQKLAALQALAAG